MHQAKGSRYRKATQGWPLFFIFAALGTAQITAAAISVNLASNEAVSALTANAARWGAFFLAIAFVASSLHRLIPSQATTWLLRNRRYFGLLFPYFTLGQWLFIGIMTHNEKGFWLWFLRDPSFLSSPLITFSYVAWFFMAAMTVTSFSSINRSLHVRPRTWRIIHKSGMLYIAGYALVTYIFYPSQLRDPNPWAVLVFGIFVVGWLMRFWLWSPAVSKLSRYFVRSVDAGATATPDS